MGDLCELESQLLTTQTEINDSLCKNSEQSAAPSIAPAPGSAPQPAPVPENVQWDEALDDQFQHALSFLNDFTGVSSYQPKEPDTKANNKTYTKAYNNNDLENNLDLQSHGHSSRINPNCDLQGNSTTDTLQTILVNTETLSREYSLDNRKSRDLSPDETDSAFSDNASLPSSGSHASVSTTVSGNSGGTSGVSSSVGGGGESSTATISVSSLTMTSLSLLISFVN